MITFFVDGGEKLGLGHIYRSINLALAFDRKIKIKFLINKSKKKNEIKLLKGIFKKSKLNLKFISNNLIKEFKKDTNLNIIFDDPNIEESKIKLANKFYSKIVVVDDENNLKKYDCDLVINQNDYSKKFNYKSSNNNLIKLLGSNYTILKEKPINSNFLLRKNVKKILLLLGATDVKNYYKYLVKKLNIYKLYIAINNKIIKDKTIILKKYKNLELLHNRNIKNIIVNKKIDVVISCCGSSLYDLFSFKIPIIGVKCSLDQNNAYKFYSKNNIILGSSISYVKKNLQKLDYKKRLTLVKNSKKFYNYNGKYILRDKIIKLIENNDKSI
jgi:spore coat polysaccharide biosynthesis predicted glycosyltransferase SpsG